MTRPGVRGSRSVSSPAKEPKGHDPVPFFFLGLGRLRTQKSRGSSPGLWPGGSSQGLRGLERVFYTGGKDRTDSYLLDEMFPYARWCGWGVAGGI